MSAITRYSHVVDVTIDYTTLASSTAVEYRGWAGGEIFIPAGTTLTTPLTWYAADDLDGTFLAAQDGTGTAVTSTIAAGKCVPIPAALFGAGAIKALCGGQAAGTATMSLKG
jgi:hypothetical protein